MRYPVRLDGFEGQTIEVESGGLFSGPKILVNRQPAPRGTSRQEVVLRRNDGTNVVATLKPSLFGLDVPQLVVAGRTISVVEPLKWYEWAWSALPILLVFVGGLLGGVLGFFGLIANARIFRSQMTGLAKFGLTAGVSLLVVVAFGIVATALGGIFK